MSHLKVLVRVRPMSEREKLKKTISTVSVDNNVISVTNIKVPEHHAGDSRERIRKFSFDFCFEDNSSQDEIFSVVEEEVSSAIANRYHACVLAYGQSSTGKTYTMMGLQNEPGLTPRLCENIFKYFEASTLTADDIKNMRTSVSYLEIYNERVQDLLCPGNNGKSLKVREHPKKGPYVQGLTDRPAACASDLLACFSAGNANRRVAATSNNRHSSRSHSVFTISCTITGSNACHRLHLVDLAGSERASVQGSTLKEGANINRSLVALGNVICALADQSRKFGKNNRKRFVPYRDSVLTWLLKETLSGNSKTVMIATVSPSSSCYSETVNTLRFGQRAKQIVNQPVVNEDAKDTLIRELRAEIERLRELLKNGLSLKTLYIENTACLEMTDSFSNTNTEQNSEVIKISNSDELDQCKDSTSQNLLLDNIEKENTEITQSKSEEILELPKKSVDEDIDQQIRSIKLDKTESLAESSKLSENNSNKSEELQESANSQEVTKTDTLIPVIDITSTVKPKIKPTQLSRTYSVDSSKLIKSKLKKSFGSNEALPNTLSISPFLANKRSTIRESTENLAKVTKSADTSSRSGSISESSGKSTPKRQPILTRRISKRSDVVAAVTQRLYSQQNKKKTEEKMGSESPVGVSLLPRQNTCSIARIKLQELTQRALKASKRKVNSETQTEDKKSATLRVKEKSTDVQDMKIALQKFKDAEVDAVIDTQSIGVNCHVENYNQTIKLTRTCASQTDEPQKSQTVSFTKYLKDPPLAIHSYTQPIYTSSVNINVSHNYPSPKGEISDDSLEDFAHQTVQYSTPDLISNHNSLEQNINQNCKSAPVENNDDKNNKVIHATLDKYSEKYFSNEYFATDSEELCMADSSVVPCSREKVKSVSVPIVCAAETCKINEFNETCLLLKDNKPILLKPVQCVEPNKKPKCFIHNKKLKPIIKAQEVSTSEESDSDSSISKKVRFSPQMKRRDMVDMLQNFMDEASTLIYKLNAVAKQVEEAEQLRNKRTIIVTQKIRDSLEDFDTKECFVQTHQPHHDASSQTSSRIVDLGGTSSLLEISDTELLDNKWEQILKSSCDKLDQCVKLAEHKTKEDERRKYQTFDSDCLHRFPQPFSSDTDWKYVPNDFSSLDTTQSASDYGSLPRRDFVFRRSPYRTYSPKAYMKQLVAMRKKIVETSRSDLMEELRLPLYDH